MFLYCNSLTEHSFTVFFKYINEHLVPTMQKQKMIFPIDWVHSYENYFNYVKKYPINKLILIPVSEKNVEMILKKLHLNVFLKKVNLNFFCTVY